MQDTAEHRIEERADQDGPDAPEAPRPGPLARLRARLFGLRLPTKLLVITLLFVMLAEVLVFVPSIASFRLNWLQNRLEAARLASLAAEASSSGVVPATVRRELLRTAQVRAVATKKADTRLLVLPSDGQLVVDASFDLRGMQPDGFWGQIGKRLGLIGDALYVFVAPSDRLLVVYGPLQSGNAATKSDDFVEVVLPEASLRADMIRHGLNVLGLSIIISVIAAAAVYLTLIQVLVRPMMRITENMVHFGENPEDPGRIIAPGDRGDEIGVAETELASMQTQLNQLLHQRKRLAELGLAVSKINHDLRNMLASAQLISDRLGELPDPSVQRFAPKLIASLDRAINFCNDTLRFGRAEEATPRRELFALAPLINDIADGLGLPSDEIDWRTVLSPTVQVDADRDHLYRVLNNLARNAAQAIESQRAALTKQHGQPPPRSQITISARREGLCTIIELSDDGPGVPAKAREHLFQAFKGGARKGGSGLGLAISAELIRAHGGTITLLDSDAGATFRIDIPDRQAFATA
ncbi:MAG: sensor histidine kinase [Hyphomicrobiaceae bacterium]